MKNGAPNIKTLSVIIPNYNKGAYVGETLDSIINQTLQPNEIIVVDDCSSDNSREILDKYSSDYPELVHVFYIPENHGVQYARNFGAEQATSEYITFIDSDDYYYNKDKLKNEIKHARPDRIVCSDFMFYDQAKEKAYKAKIGILDRIDFLLAPLECLVYKKSMYAWPFAYIFSKESFNSVNGYDFTYNLYEDTDIIIKLMLNGNKVWHLHRIGRAYRINDQMTTHLSKAKQEARLTALSTIREKYSGLIPLYEKCFSGFIGFLKTIVNLLKRAIAILCRFFKKQVIQKHK